MSRPFRNPLRQSLAKLNWKLDGNRLVVPPQWGLTTLFRLAMVLPIPVMTVLKPFPKREVSILPVLVGTIVFARLVNFHREFSKGRKVVERKTNRLFVSNREFLLSDFDAIVVGDTFQSRFGSHYRIGLKKAGKWKRVGIITEIEREEDAVRLAGDLQKLTGYPIMMPGEHYC